jgi:lipopolysaccharide transport system ATP-binding protein
MSISGTNPNSLAIVVENVSKAYRVWQRPMGRLTSPLLETVGNMGATTAGGEWLLKRARTSYREFWALQEVSFSLRKGASMGILGRNGSGKSTLLQIIAGTLTATSGRVAVTGRVGALLELGSGFNPEFTGRENIALAAAILGIPNELLPEKLAWIEKFAEVGDYIDQPFKTYSSGMGVRLAFATQIAMEPDVLIVDEALSVGDMFFEHKCLTRIKQLMDQGTSLLLVSHSLQTVKSICSSAMLLVDGRIDMLGDCRAVADRYTKRHAIGNASPSPALRATEELKPPSPVEVHISRVQQPWKTRAADRASIGVAEFVECAVFVDGIEVDTVPHDSEVCVSAWIRHHEHSALPGEVGVVVRSITGLDLFAINSYFNGIEYPPQPAGALVRVDFRCKAILAPGKYAVSLGLRAPIQGQYLDKVFGAAIFAVVTNADEHVAGFFDANGNITIQRLG